MTKKNKTPKAPKSTPVTGRGRVRTEDEIAKTTASRHDRMIVRKYLKKTTGGKRVIKAQADIVQLDKDIAFEQDSFKKLVLVSKRNKVSAMASRVSDPKEDLRTEFINCLPRYAERMKLRASDLKACGVSDADLADAGLVG
jgi:hypothetical protein